MLSLIKKLFKGTLLKSAYNGNIKAVRRHLAEEADVNAEDEGGNTPLLLAASSGHKEIVELLITKGAKVNAKNRQSVTPLDVTIFSDSPEIANLLRKHGGKSGGEDSIHAAAIIGDIEAVKKHLDAGVSVNTKDTEDNTPLDILRSEREWDEIGWPPKLKSALKETVALLRKHGGKTAEELKAEGK